MKLKVNDLIFESIVDVNGAAVFNDIPKACYTLTALDNDFFKSGTRTISLPHEREIQNQISIYLPLDRQDSFTSIIKVVNPKHNEEEKQNDEKIRYYSNLELSAVLLELYNKENNDFDDDSEIEYEAEFDETLDKTSKC